MLFQLFQGYARDIIEVVEDESGETVRCLLYRGTHDNPAFWPRALRDLPFAAGKHSIVAYAANCMHYSLLTSLSVQPS